MLNMPGPLAKLGLSQELKAAMLKLTAALPASRRLDEERVRQRYYIDASWWSQGDEQQPQLQAIQQAVWEDRKLVITYIPLFDMHIERVVDPYGLAAKSGSWYLVFAHGGRVRARRVADLLETQLCAEKFERPADFILEEFWKRWCEEEAQNTSSYVVTVRVSKAALPAVMRRFRGMMQDQIAQTPEAKDGSLIIRLYFRWIDEARERLLPFGSSLEVLEPYALRASIADISEQTARLYRKLTNRRAVSPSEGHHRGEVGPTSTSESPGSSHAEPSASTVWQASQGSSMRMVFFSPGASVIREKPLSALFTQVAEVTTSDT